MRVNIIKERKKKNKRGGAISITIDRQFYRTIYT